MSQVITADDVVRIARAVARRYARRCWWADVDDLTGEASRAVLEAKERWDPQVGVPFEGYGARAATNALRDYLWRQSSPVSGGMHDPRRTLGELRRAPLDHTTEDGEAVPRVEISHRPDPGVNMDDQVWRMRVRKRIRELAARTQNGDLALEVMVHGKEHEEIRRESGAGQFVIYRSVELVRRKIKSDYPLYKLWQHKR